MTAVVFFGTPEEAVPALDSLHRAFEVARVVTRPDRPRGRSRSPQPSPVKAHAVRAGIPVSEPATGSELRDAIPPGADLGVVVAYGRILRPDVLDAFPMGILNIHFSLLPRWRGAAPVARALMAGDTMTGVTIIRLDEGLDTGPVLTAQAVDIDPSEDAGELTARLSRLGAALLVRSVPSYLGGELEPVPQSDAGATYAAKIGPGDRPLDGDLDPEVFLGRVRGLAPDPGATLVVDGETLKVLAASREAVAPSPGTWSKGEAGPVVNVGGAGITLTRVQSPGRRAMTGEEWLRGRHRASGTVG